MAMKIALQSQRNPLLHQTVHLLGRERERERERERDAGGEAREIKAHFQNEENNSPLENTDSACETCNEVSQWLFQ